MDKIKNNRKKTSAENAIRAPKIHATRTEIAQ